MARTRRRRKSRFALVGLTVVVAAGAVGGWLWLRPRSPKPADAAQAPAAVTKAEPKKDETKPLATNKPEPKLPGGSTRLVADTQPAKPPRPTSAPAITPTSAPSVARPAAPTSAPVATPHGAPTSAPTSLPSTPLTSKPAASTQPALSPPAPSTTPTVSAPPPPAAPPARPGRTEIDAARRQIDAGQWLEARERLSAQLGGKLPEADENEVRQLLAKVAEETVFGKRVVASDPLVETYAVKSGDVLLNIGKRFDVPAEALMLINGISNPKTIRADQKLKVVRGPFNVKIYKSKFRMDIYLGNVYLRSYAVGLGAENGTPEGVWKVKERLEHPTYYPSASAPDKHIIGPDDPKNPLGERWIGLVGVEGAAVGHDGYGIHGTIEPDSIGKAVSLGCIRMHNEDVATVYKMMQPGRSTVTILP